MKANFKHVLAVIVLCQSLLIPACSNKIDLKKENASLLETDLAYATVSVNEGTAKAFQKFLTENAIQFTGNGEIIRGNEAVYKYMLAAMDTTTFLDWEPQEAEVSEKADMGYTWGNYIVYKKQPAGGLDSVSSGKYVNIWTKQPDGSWKVSLDIGNVRK